mmetsp:Transcript_71278/g.202107  ORF Transcript_71278/g.202107 Transcript_71278/m.202107 type:complete len:210 (-) Transcript_71278:48-677(-)
MFSPIATVPSAASDIIRGKDDLSRRLGWESSAREVAHLQGSSPFKAASPQCALDSSSDDPESESTSDEEDSSNGDSPEMREGECPLTYAIRRGQEAEVERLLREGADPNAADECGQTHLFKAAATGNLVIVASLLLASGDPSLRSKAGATALDVARDRRLQALMTAMAPADEGLVADAWLLDEAVLQLPEHLRGKVLDAAESELRKMQI